jgi:hypothetical protein
MKRWINLITLSLFLYFVGPLPPAMAMSQDQMTIIVKSSPHAAFESHLDLMGKKVIKRLLQGKQMKAERPPEIPYAYLEVSQDQKVENYLVGYSLQVFLPDKGTKIELTQTAKEQLSAYIQWLYKHHYGKPLPWREAAKIFPRKGFAEVIDVETGLSFRVQRRAGSQHADVQPLTAKDTKIMKQIYNGQWSWNRRAIIVHSGDQLIAASMHGMPHGAGAIRGNKFPGHFCIHFKDSTTHKRRGVTDPGHDLMISKASGDLYRRIVQGPPEELVSLFVSAINEQDYGVAKLILNQSDKDYEKLILVLQDIEMIKLKAEPKKATWPENQLVADIPVQIQMKRKGSGEQLQTIPFTFTRGGSLERWELDPRPLLEKFEGKVKK